MTKRFPVALFLVPVLFAGCATQQPAAAGSAGAGGAAASGDRSHLTAGARALLATDTNSEQDFRKIINGAKAKVFPAVVFIKCVQQDLTGGDKSNREVAGSGALISAEGQVLTNWHVIDKAVELRCLLYDGRAFNAKVVGSDKDTDLALLQLVDSSGEPAKAGTSPFPFAHFGDSSKLQEGDFVMAMGAPWGLSRSVSLGIISCTKRFLPSTSEYSIWLQTDASISPGNSGGPLVNTDGEIVGVNTRGVTSGGDLGFAVPSETILPVVAQIRTSGKVDWSWTGVQLQPLKDFNRNMYFEGTDGVIVADTDPDSPARHAGLQPRDRILKINTSAVAAVTDEDLPETRRLLGTLPKDKAATIQLLRGDSLMTLQLTPREKGKVEGEEFACARWDCTVKTINQFDNPDLYFQRKQGVFIFGIKQPGNAANAGLEQDDILLKVDNTAVASLSDLQAVHEKTVKGIADRPRIVLTVLRNGLLRQIVLDLSRDYSKE
jgi:serine protease Do